MINKHDICFKVVEWPPIRGNSERLRQNLLQVVLTNNNRHITKT